MNECGEAVSMRERGDEQREDWAEVRGVSIKSDSDSDPSLDEVVEDVRDLARFVGVYPWLVDASYPIEARTELISSFTPSYSAVR